MRASIEHYILVTAPSLSSSASWILFSGYASPSLLESRLDRVVHALRGSWRCFEEKLLDIIIEELNLIDGYLVQGGQVLIDNVSHHDGNSLSRFVIILSDLCLSHQSACLAQQLSIIFDHRKEEEGVCILISNLSMILDLLLFFFLILLLFLLLKGDLPLHPPPSLLLLFLLYGCLGYVVGELCEVLLNDVIDEGYIKRIFAAALWVSNRLNEIWDAQCFLFNFDLGESEGDVRRVDDDADSSLDNLNL